MLYRTVAAATLLLLPGSIAAQSVFSSNSSTGGAAPVADYSALTDARGDVPNFFPEPFTGLAVDSNDRLWAVNPHANLIVGVSGGQARREIGTGLNPVSIAVVEDRPLAGDRKLLVVCVGTEGLFIHNADDGRIEGYRQLGSEPADIVFDEDLGRAFVSCQGNNAVLELDPFDPTVPIVAHGIPVGERPGYLYLDYGGAGAADNRVYVAASVTGNNSTLLNPAGNDAGIGVVLDLNGNPGGELDDWDVYAIDATNQTVQEVVSGAGSLLFDLERHPEASDDRLWILSTDSLNADPARQSEPALKGNFVINQLVLTGGVDGSALVAAGPKIDLDDTDPATPGAQYETLRSINQARALDFAFGGGLIASPLSDVILWCDPDGNRVLELDLPSGAQCYDVEPLLSNFLAALCVGTGTIEIFRLLPFQSSPIASYSLGSDPTPAQIRAGRDLFLDGKLSEKGRSSCASCHPRGMSDQLGWSLIDPPNDQKDVNVTQSLLSIADTFPHHWRGERDMKDFQKAFAGLLGGSDDGEGGRLIDDDEMDDFTAFVQSLRAPSNAIQDPLRVVNDSLSAGPIDGDEPFPTGSPVQGQIDFENSLISSLGFVTCADCHIVETGGDGNLFSENGGQVPRAVTVEVAHLRQLQNKGRGSKVLSFDTDGDGTLDETRRVNESGFGLAHNGVFATLRTFVEAFPLTDQEVSNIVAFIDQFDSGLSKSAQTGIWYAIGENVEAQIDSVLLANADRGWHDVVAVGRFGSPLSSTRWVFDPKRSASGMFVAENSAQPDIDWATMMSETQAGRAEHVFFGVPPGSGARFAIDYDGDGIRNGDDSTPWHNDQPDDGQPPSVDEWSIDLSTARLAKLELRTSEEAKYTVFYQARPKPFGSGPGPLRSITREDFVREDTIVLTHSEPSVPDVGGVMGYDLEFDAWIELEDRQGNPSGPIPLEATPGAPAFISRPFFPENPLNIEPILLHIQNLEITRELIAFGTVRLEIEVEVRANKGAPDYELAPEPQMVFFTVSSNLNGDFQQIPIGSGAGQMTTQQDTSFLVAFSSGTVPYTSPPGEPWVVSNLTDPVTGKTRFWINLHQFPSGTQFRVSAMGILPVDSSSGGTTIYAPAINQMQPLLLEDAAVIEFQVP